MPLLKIVSGGQTGVDRAALDAALALAFPAGGWCPEGRLAEDGPIPARYPLEELPGGGYPERTRRNVMDSDGTVIIYFDALHGGTLETQRICEERSKPHLLLNARMVPEEKAAEQIIAFIREHDLAVLNVAGPRASKEPGAYGYALATITRLLQSLRIPATSRETQK
ncbi:MAG: putative molybdenum carrier protein [Gammaproteobacteria bacterium]|nr:putative molybdenum carrier protein [Gammaproteobacteria bacterium]